MSLEKLPGEGDIETVTVIRTRLRHECDECGEPASFKHTFLLKGYRSNPASSAYQKDDCSWCQDAHSYVCMEHKEIRRAPDGYLWCSTFPASAHLAHMFLYWRETKTKV